MRRTIQGGIVASLSVIVVCAAGCGSPRTPVEYVNLNETAVQQRISDIRAGGGSSSDESTQQVAQGTGWGTLRGVFKFEGEVPPLAPLLTAGKDATVGGQVVCGDSVVNEALVVDPANKGIANIVVFARKVEDRVREPAGESAPPVFDQKGCRFLSHVMGVMTNQELIIKNSDPVGHNTSISPTGDASINQLLSAGGETTYTFNRAQSNAVAVTCDVHKWMKAYIIPRDNPYFAVTASDGSFEIADIPAGQEVEFQIWHEMAGGRGGGLVAQTQWARGRFKLTIPEDGVEDLGTIQVPAAAFQ